MKKSIGDNLIPKNRTIENGLTLIRDFGRATPTGGGDRDARAWGEALLASDEGAPYQKRSSHVAST
jgi:hypothetical protein